MYYNSSKKPKLNLRAQRVKMGKVSEFYSGKNIFISGATGFLGKVLLFKLLTEFQDLSKVYVLIRGKWNETSEERFKKLLKNEIFADVKPSQLSKIHLVSGDVCEDGLGLTEQEESELIQNVHVVFHLAASVKFNDPIKKAVNNNVRGPWRMIKLAAKMKNLEVFLHTSTTFVHCYQVELEERYYPTNLDPFEVMKLSESQDETFLELYENELLTCKAYPNTYCLTKALGEDLVYSYRNTLPIVILRPSLTLHAMSEPGIGYVDGFTGATTVFYGMMAGVVRCMYAQKHVHMRVTPVDFVANATIVSAHERTTMPAGDIAFFNCTDAEENKWKWHWLLRKEYLHKNVPYQKLVWCPTPSVVDNEIMFYLRQYVFQMFAALIFDFVRLLTFSKPFMVQLQWKVNYALRFLFYFSETDWKFRSDKLQELFSGLSDEEKIRFNFNHAGADPEVYLRIGYEGIRKYLFSEGPETKPKAQRKLFVLGLVNLLLEAALTGIVVLIFWPLISYVWNRIKH